MRYKGCYACVIMEYNRAGICHGRRAAADQCWARPRWAHGIRAVGVLMNSIINVHEAVCITMGCAQ